jgi:purine-nucleoside phosphorylase
MRMGVTGEKVSIEKLYSNLEEASKFIKEKIGGDIPETAITLGSGLGLFVDSLENKIAIPYNEIPHFHQTTVVGHSGTLVVGESKGKKVLALQGRIHAYEGHSFEEVVFPTRVLKSLGVKNLLLTNASGGMNSSYKAGDLILIEDHLNLTGANPLHGKNPDKLGTRFPDMTNAWNSDLKLAIKKGAEKISYNLKSGVYVGVLGPSYETPAEIKMYTALGGDMVGMSTVAEAIAGHHCGLRVAGISCITNMAAGIHQGELDHSDIKDQANQVSKTFVDLVVETIQNI